MLLPIANTPLYVLIRLVNIFTDVIIILLPITMVSRLQMKLKDKIGVAGIFALGFFVVIASSTYPRLRNSTDEKLTSDAVVRAYYSKRNETMLTCTVSMIETAIAIIATCLPALRSMVLGTNTTKGDSNSYGRHYELSNAGRKAKVNHLTASHATSGAHSSHNPRSRANGSEDSLFSDNHLQAGNGDVADGKIVVDTQIDTMFEDIQSTASSAKAKSPFN
jgi:hypothetical protein